MSTSEVLTALEFKDTCGMGTIPLSSNNTISLASVNNEYGSLDENNEDLNSYIFAAYYGKNGAGNAEFYSYSTIRWKKPLYTGYRDVIVVGLEQGTPNYRMESSHLVSGIKGYLQNTILCANLKYPGAFYSPSLCQMYESKTNTYIYETTRLEDQIFSNNDNQITVNMSSNTIVCTVPITLGQVNCNAQCDGYTMIHTPLIKENKLLVSGNFIMNPEDGWCTFVGAYYHTKKELAITPSASLGVSYNGAFSFSGSLGGSFIQKYVEKEYYMPQITAQFNRNEEFYGFN